MCKCVSLVESTVRYMEIRIMKFLKDCFRTIFEIVVNIVVFPIYIPLALLFAVYRQCVDFVLKKKLAENYGGLLSGGDQYFACEPEIVNAVVNILCMVEAHQENFFATVKHCFKTRLFDAPERLPKFAGVCKQAYGFFYVLNNAYSVDECVREVQDQVSNEDDLQAILTKYANLPLPKNHTTFWEVLVCKNAIKWNNSKKCYPIIVRCNHSISDGTNLAYALAKSLTDVPLIPPIVPKLAKSKKMVLRLKKLLFDVYIMITLPAFLLTNVILKRRDSNWFMTKTLSKKPILAFKVEDPEIVTKIKKIKNSVPGTSFTGILITAVSASYEEHMAKNGLEVPENFTVLSPINFNLPDIYEKPPVLVNNFGALLLDTPIRWRSSSLIDKLKEVSRRQKTTNRNSDIHGYYWMLSMVPHYLPLAVVQPQKALSFTMTISNLPSTPSYQYVFGGCLVDVITSTNHICNSGMTLVFHNYGGERLQLGLSVDSSLINSVAEMHDILNGIKNNVNIMYKELNFD